MRIQHIPVQPVARQQSHASATGIYFGNLPFSSAIKCNRHSPEVQGTQEHNLFVPSWAMQPVIGFTDTADPFEAIFAELTSHVVNGMNIHDLCGDHAFLGALDDAETFHRAPILSQQIARIVHSIRAGHGSTTFTHYALMHWYWSLWRWMLFPWPDTYCDIPSHARPTPYQLFVPHPRVFDFLAQPNLRDLMCQAGQPDVRWLSEGAATIQCEWEGGLSSALSKNGITNELELNPLAKVRKT